MKRFTYFFGIFLLSAAVLAEPAAAGYLTQSEIDQINITQALPPVPTAGDPIDAVDVAYFWAERSLLLTHRGQEAAEDDVYLPQFVWPRFSTTVGSQKLPNETELQTLFALMNKAMQDASTLVAPLKKNLPEGRTRPFVRFTESPTCLEPYDLVPGHKNEDYSHNLQATGSYPSTHAAIGILWASVLSELYPTSEAGLWERGISFGESRAVCGFHFESDVSAGRVAGRLLFGKLMANKHFAHEIRALRQTIGGGVH